MSHSAFRQPFLPALAVAAVLTSSLTAADLRFFDDAALHAVQFIDKNEGWAVGDEGAVWHSIDGGRSWERQQTFSRASLRAVHFLDPFTGWVAGREELPHGGGSVGVVLVTKDGGLEWKRLSANTLPGLNCLRFFDAQTGLAAGDGSEQYPSGVFATDDGGQTWKALPGPRCPGWLAADFSDSQTGALAGAWSRLATFRPPPETKHKKSEGILGTADVDTLGGRSLHGLRLIGNRAVAVGQGGLVLNSSTSAGLRWGFTGPQLSREILACIDWHAVAMNGNHVWAAGRPGSVLLHSADQGSNWELVPTGQSLPLHGIHFLDEEHGWAVGELGTVLATADAGKTWKVQRQGGQRAAVLSVHALPGEVPLDTVALLGGEEGYLVTALQVTSPDPASAVFGRAAEPQRLNAALRLAAGASGESLWQFPLPQHLLVGDKQAALDAWEKLHRQSPAQELLRQMVLALRIWRPDVIITDSPEDAKAAAKTGNSLGELVSQAVQEAFARAGDPAAFPEQIEKLGLEPWKASKLYCRCASTNGAQVVLDLTEAKPRLQATLRDVAGQAAGLLADEPPLLPTQAAYRLLADRTGAKNPGDLMAGIVLAPEGTARRALPEMPTPPPAAAKAVQASRNLQALAQTPLTGLVSPDKLLAQIGPALASLPYNQGASASFAIASQYARTGQWTLAREAYLLMVERYPNHPLAADAYRWLIRHNSSSEARRRQELGQFLAVTESTVGQAKEADPERPEVHGGTEPVHKQQVWLKSTSPISALGDGRLNEVRLWYQGCLQVGQRFAGFGPLFERDPAVQFCLQSARRNLGEDLGDLDKTKQWYGRFLAEHANGPWHDAAAAELWLLTRNGPPPKPVAMCRQTATRPFLDGNFDDECWQGVLPLRLRNAVGDTIVTDPKTGQPRSDYATEAWFTYDQEYLYLALRCKHPADRYVPPVTVRQRDADMQDYDRVSLLLDLDRDYSTCFHLQVDQRGCLREECWGDKSWNPRWYVAVKSEKTCWQIEAAIPLIELTGDKVTIGRAWACNVVRVLPGRGVQAWSLPADVQPRPEGMGLLLFSAEPRRTETTRLPKVNMAPSGN